MSWISELGGLWLTMLEWLAGLTAAFAVLVRLMPCNPGMYWWKDLRGVAADAVYWLLGPLLARLGRTLLLIAGVGLLFGGLMPQPLPVNNLPLGLQCAAILLIQDVLLYAMHRLFHTRLGWGFHAVHHSPKMLDWTAAVRFHPVNNLLEFALADVTVLLLGFSPSALLILAPINVLYSAMVHANLNWTFGPLRYIVASPVFHRWHHTSEEEGLDKNFASTFPFLDVLFGTFYMPPGKLPERFGNGTAGYPEGFWGQLIQPFRRNEHPDTAILTACGLTSMLLVGSTLVYRTWQTNRDTPSREEAQTAPQVIKIDPARPAWAGGNLVSASAINTVAVSADGARIVSGDEGGIVKVWDAEPLTLKGHQGRVSGVAFSADGRRIVSCGTDGTVRLWNAVTGEAKQTLTGHAGPVLSVAVSADGRRIASGGADGTVKIWDGDTGRLLRSLTTDTDAVTGVAISADGRRVGAVNFKTAVVWATETGREELALAGHVEPVYTLAMSPDGETIVTGSFDGTAKIWDGRTGREKCTLIGHTGTIYALALSSDGRRVVSGSDDRTVKVWDATSGREERTFTDHADTVTGVVFAPDGGRVISGSRDGTVKVWDIGEQQTTALASPMP
jgi:WD40 repeat protein/sterol desaturase/sphingolipid hydroxylase (fatty acid hydroxylase superfamily)